jgi:hypothetical protein
MNKMLSLIAGGTLLALASTAYAGQPLQLSEKQMDRVTAGGVALANAAALALGYRDANYPHCQDCLAQHRNRPGVQSGTGGFTAVPGRSRYPRRHSGFVALTRAIAVH